MENKHGSGRAGSLEGKGFYIVLFLCAAVIGVSAWILFTDVGTNVDEMTAAVDVSDAVVTMLPANWVDEQPEDLEVFVETEEEEAEDAMSEDAEESVEAEAPAVQEVFSETVTSYVWPVQGSVARPYAIQTLLYDSTMADWRTHDGIDVACDLGTQVMAAAGGTVTRVETDDLLGTTVEIDHANGVHTVYSNLAGQPPVSAGDIVTMGQIIGSVGSTALAETNQVSHLHFAMTMDGISADPMTYLPSNEAE